MKIVIAAVIVFIQIMFIVKNRLHHTQFIKFINKNNSPGNKKVIKTVRKE